MVVCVSKMEWLIRVVLVELSFMEKGFFVWMMGNSLSANGRRETFTWVKLDIQMGIFMKEK